MAVQTLPIAIILLAVLTSHNSLARSTYDTLTSPQELSYLLAEPDNSDESYPDVAAGKVSDADVDLIARWLLLKNVIPNIEFKSPSSSPSEGGITRKSISKGHVQKKSNYHEIRNGFVSPKISLLKQRLKTRRVVSAWGEYMTPCHFKICNFGRKRNVFNF